MIWAFALLGYQWTGRMGAWTTVLLSLTAGWIALLTYAGKLLPFYGGGIGRSTAGNLWLWWHTSALQDLQAVVPTNVSLVLLLTGAHAALVVWAVAQIVRRFRLS